MIPKSLIQEPSMTDVEMKYVVECMKTGWDNYYYVEKFEQDFARYHNRKYGLMTQSCTSALHLILKALGIGENDEIIVPELTWVASARPVEYCGAAPVFADIDSANWCVNPDSVARLVGARTKGVIAVDLHGNMPDYHKLESVCNELNLFLVEDAAQGVGSIHHGIKAGEFGIASAFSFHRTKTLSCGEGGIILTDKEELYEKCRILRNHGRYDDDPEYFVREGGYKYTPANLNASVLCGQFERIEELVGKKRAILNIHRNRLPELTWNYEPDNCQNGAWVSAAVLPNMDKQHFIKLMGQRGVPICPGFYPLSGQLAFHKYRDRYWDDNGYSVNKVAYDLSSRIVNFPSALTIEKAHILEVCEKTREVLNLACR